MAHWLSPPSVLPLGAIDLVREVPEALKPRRIEVKAGGPTVIEAKQAA